MLILLSPAKTLDFESPLAKPASEQPRFVQQAAELIKVLKKLSADEICDLMKLSESLGKLNHGRYRQWQREHTAENSRHAIYAFQGDVYQGLDIASCNAAGVRRCQKHVRILSGLYGILNPLDLIQPYRLEMGTRLKNKSGSDLYRYWGDQVRDVLSSELRESKGDLIVNLASNEYSKVAKLSTIDTRVISPGFKDWKNGQFKMISFFAKKARGQMARYLIDHNVKKAEGILGFNYDGYQFNEELSSEAIPVFTRKQ